MKKAMMAMTMLFALGCFAQTTGSGSGQSAGSSQSGSMSNGSQSGTTDQSGSPDSMNNRGSMNSSDNMKGEKTLKGCIESANGSYMLQEKHGKSAMLSSSQDLSAHVGHMVKVHGMWQAGTSSANSGSMGSTSSANGGTPDHNGQTFMVDKLDMVSTQCKMDKNMDKNSGESMH
jgi:hypothetical protein